MTPLIPPESDSDLECWPARNLEQQLFQIELAKMYPGNRLRLMFNLPLLPETTLAEAGKLHPSREQESQDRTCR